METGLSIILIQAIHGLVYGMLLFLVASGLTLVFGMMDVLNIAHAGFYMLGAYIGSTIAVVTGNFLLALLLAPLAMAILGALVERFFLRKVHVHGHAFELLITFGVFYVIGEVVKWFWGNFPRAVDVPPFLSGAIPIFGATYPAYRGFILLISFLILVTMLYVFMKTRRASTSGPPSQTLRWSTPWGSTSPGSCSASLPAARPSRVWRAWLQAPS